jgi:lipoprotein-releasing system ATP-binding protein
MAGARVEIKGLRKSYDFGAHRAVDGRRPRGHDPAQPARSVDVLKGIDLSIAPGEMVAVVGASGAGKSTFLHVLGTLDQISAGSIDIDGKNVATMGPAELAEFRNHTIGFVFQFHHLLPEFTAVENVSMPAFIAGVPRDEATASATDLLQRVGLGHRLDHRPGELSGGEQQRVALARALIMKPRLLLADEPTGNLDTRTGNAIHELVVELNQERGMTMLVVTHNEDLAARMPRRLHMVDGRIFEDAGAHAPSAEVSQ